MNLIFEGKTMTMTSTMNHVKTPKMQIQNEQSKKARFWDKIAEKYAKSKIGDEAGYNHTVERTIALLKPRDQVVELGCGTGSTALRLAPHVAQFTGTDISGGMIDIARRKNVAAAVPGLRFEVATSASVAAPDQGFDAVLGYNYLHLVPDLESALVDIHTMLKPGGLFVSKTPCLGEMNFLIRLALPLMRLVGKAPEDVVFFDREELKSAMRAAGFEIKLVEMHGTKGKDIRPFIVARKV